MTEPTSGPYGPFQRILWNRRPADDRDSGDIDEIVLTGEMTVHIEQQDDRCWWIGLYGADGSTWMGNFTANSRGHMRFTEQENDGIEWDADESHEDKQRGDHTTYDNQHRI